VDALEEAGGRVKLEVTLDAETLTELGELAQKLGVPVEELAAIVLDVVSDYRGFIGEWAERLRVRREHRAVSVFEELVYYGVEAWRGVVEPVLRRLRASGRYELEMLEFDPDAPAIEMEFYALEGSDLQADRIRLYWTPQGVTLEAYYYLEEGIEPPIASKEEAEWDYLPDEHAIVITVTAPSIDRLPPIHAVDRKAEAILLR
jgi:HAMP domain-containing protein